MYDVCEKYEILDKIQLSTSVQSCRWIVADQEWEVTLDHLAPGVGDMSSIERAEYEKVHGETAAVLRTEIVRAKAVVSCCGGLVEPKQWNHLPGIDSFQGEIMHTARWDSSVDLHDKNVVIVGTGCSGAQVMPQLVKPQFGAKRVTQLMRSPPWMVPGPTPDEKKVFKKWVPRLSTYIPGFQAAVRRLLFCAVEAEWYALFAPTEKARAARRKKADQLLRYMKKMAPEKYHDILTPDYEVFCKRRVVDDQWYTSLNDDRIELTTQPLTRVNEKTVTIGPGRTYPPASDTSSKHPTEQREIDADVIVMANGYVTNTWLHPLEVIGKDGVSMEKVWDQRGGAQAYLGLAMDGFPNFFIVFGPNTATGHTSVILATENAVDYTLKFVKSILRGDVESWEVTERAERAYTEQTQRELKNSLFNSGGCANWYVNESGWNSSTYPRSQIDATIRHMFPVWSHWQAKYTTKGLMKLHLGRILKLVGALSAVMAVVYRLRFGQGALTTKVVDVAKTILDLAKRSIAGVATRQ